MNIAPDDRGLAYGDGVFETVRFSAGRAPLVDLHWQRLQQGLTRLQIRFDLRALNADLDTLRAQQFTGVTKFIITRGSGGRGYAAPTSPLPRLIVQQFPLPLWSDQLRQHGLELGVCQQRLADAPSLAGIKHLNRLEQVMARAEVSAAGWQEGLLLDSLGRPQELTSMNLFARFGDIWWTPSLSQSGVLGVARHWCLQQLVQQSKQIDQRAISLSRLREADEVFACNSVAGLLPVRKLAVWRWSVGADTCSLQHQFEQLFRS